MRPSDWDNPRIRKIGQRYATRDEAYDLATELDDYGADAARLLNEQDPNLPQDVRIPAKMADVLMAVLLYLAGPPPRYDAETGAFTISTPPDAA